MDATFQAWTRAVLPALGLLAGTVLTVVPAPCRGAILEEVNGAPDEFMLYLQDKLDRYEQGSHGYWQENQIGVTGNAKAVGKKVQVYLQFRDLRRPKHPTLASWQGTVPPGGSVASAQKCLSDVLPKLDPAQAVRNLAQANNLKGIHLSLSFVPGGQPRPGGVYYEGDPLVLHVKTTAAGWITLFNMNPEDNPQLSQIWPVKAGDGATAGAGEIKPGEEGVRVSGSIEKVGSKRQEMIVAVVWRNRNQANQLAAAAPQTLGDLAKTIRKLTAPVAGGKAASKFEYALAYLPYMCTPKPGEKGADR